MFLEPTCLLLWSASDGSPHRIDHIASHGIESEEVEEACFGKAPVLRARSGGKNPVYKGIERLDDSRHKSALAEWLEGDLLIRFQDRILPIDTGLMLIWGELTADLEKQGRTMPAIDSLIAATALQGGLGLVTRNEDDFANSGVAFVNPWQQQLLRIERESDRL